ncbi:translation initiation factor IF-2 [uncultured Veillonella sp.]|uniref:translation initiation factor IF-2 n=1 Tax=uncultured Veillonella sp. TaxID=159268 RepID=UPI0025999206|nr:translation initiation factor IF-2 [uncultured Veillonella sp.]
MSKKRIYEVAKELGVKNQQVIDVLQKHNIEAKNNFNAIDEKAIDIVKKALKGNDKPQAKTEQNGHQDKGGHATQNNRAQDTRANEDRSHDNRNNGGKQNHRKQSEKQEARHNDRHEKRDNNRDGNRKHDNAKNEGRHGNGHDNNRSNDSNRGNDSNRNERNDRRNKRGDNHGDDRRGKNDNRNDRRNRKDKKNKRDGNRPQSLLSTSLAKSKNKVKQRNEQNRQHKEEEKRRAEAAIATAIELDGPLTVKELADKMGREVSEIIKKLMFLGVMATINQEIDVDTATIVAEDFGVEVTEVEPAEDPTEIKEIEDAPETLQPRPPVVTIMGHVDHGKTSLLDVIRQTNVTAHEAGGITQHIGAYMVRYKGNKITFLDTPGHEAFTAMRLRGAQSTDIAVLVVAADDGVMPQTIEAINHAKSANVPVLVAINKMDKPGANPDHVKQQLAEHGLLPEEWGGDTIMVPVSAKKRQGIDDLLENILLVAEVMELKANPNRHAQGVVIEAKLDKGRGPVCTVLVQKGTLRVGDTIIAGTAFGKVRAMTNERGEKVKAARPSMPVEVLGLSDVPQAGEIMDAVDDNEARTIAEKRIEKQRVSEMQRTHKVTLDDIFNQIQQGELKDLNIIIKADVQGSVEALRQSLEAIKNPEVRIVIVHAAVGAINESDVMLASASNAIIIGFNVRPDALVRKAAEKENVDLRTYRVIYDAINDVENAMRGMLTPEFKEVILGRAEVRQVISTPKAIVAGSYVTEGKITNNSEIRLIRDGIVVHEGKVDSLRRFKDEVKEVKSSFECGISIEKYRDIKEGDVIEAYVMEEITPQL